jgi:hypothetical protein
MPQMTRVSSPHKRTALRKKRRQAPDQTEGQPAHIALPASRQALHPETVLQIQQAVGNRSVQQLMSPPQPANDVLQRRPGDQEKIETYLKKFPERANLLTGFDDAMSETDIVGQLIENFFKRRDFTYNFTSSASWGNAGDCTTLAREFIELARDVFGIPMSMKSDTGGFLIPGGRRIVNKDDQLGNIDEGKFWYFAEHTWVEWAGKQIDVLFGQLGVVSHQKGVTVTYDENGMPTYEVGGFKFYHKDGATSQLDGYTSDDGLRQKKPHF